MMGCFNAVIGNINVRCVAWFSCLFLKVFPWAHCLPSSVCTILSFLPRDCLLPICSTYTKHSTQEVLQAVNKVTRVKYWIILSVCVIQLFDHFFFISILIDHYPVSHCHKEKTKWISKKRQASLGILIRIYAPVKGSFYVYVRHIATICITPTMGLPTWDYIQCTYLLPSPTFPSPLYVTKLS